MNRKYNLSGKKVLLVAGAVVVLLAVMLVRTVGYGLVPNAVATAPDIAISEGFAERLAAAVRIPTVSHHDPAAFDSEPFRTLNSYLQTAFPKVHAELKRETVAAHSLLYTWTGSDPSLNPILLVGHLDVVPIEPGTEDAWIQPPFSGHIADGFIWGRGAIDNKSAVIGALEAVEMLLGEGFRPIRTVYLAYGHDEEVGGMAGARKIAELLERRGIRIELLIDEGGVIGDGILPGISAPVAMVGIAEKGFVSIELSTETRGGHSSLPSPQTAVGVLSAAIARLEENPMTARLEGATRQFFDRVGPQFPFFQRAAFANLWLTRSMVLRNLESSPATNAMIRTTTAATIFQAGAKDNVLPTHARAVINFRILPGDSIADVVDHVRKVINDVRVDIRKAGAFSAEPSTLAMTDSESYRMLERSIQSVTPDAIVAPYLVVVVTDSRHYAGLTNSVLRFLPVQLTSQDLERIHGTGERIAICNYARAIRTYRQIIKNAASH